MTDRQSIIDDCAVALLAAARHARPHPVDRDALLAELRHAHADWGLPPAELNDIVSRLAVAHGIALGRLGHSLPAPSPRRPAVVSAGTVH
jgi:hypothetical protein